MLSDAQRERWDFDVMLARDTRDRGREYSDMMVAPSLLVAVDDELRELRAALAAESSRYFGNGHDPLPDEPDDEAASQPAEEATDGS